MTLKPEQIPDASAELRSMAGRVAERLVAHALQELARAAAPMVITVHAEPVRPKLLLSGRRKPGPKPKAAARARRNAPTSAMPPAGDVLQRQCRKCFKKGTAKPLGDGRARCTSCGFEWKLRRSKFEAVTPAPIRKPNAKAQPGHCGRCDHSLARHVGLTGECLEPKCGCSEALL